MILSENAEAIYMQQGINNSESTEGLFILNPDGNFTYLNEKALSFAGEKYGKLAGKPFISIIPEKERRRFYREFINLLNGKSIRLTVPKYEYGSKHVFELNINPIARNRKIVMLVGTIRDITYIKKIEAEKKIMMSRERIFRESIAHHFFNPLAIAKGYLQIVIDNKPNKDDMEKLEAAKTAIKRVESVVKNVIKYGDIRE